MCYMRRLACHSRRACGSTAVHLGSECDSDRPTDRMTPSSFNYVDSVKIRCIIVAVCLHFRKLQNVQKFLSEPIDDETDDDVVIVDETRVKSSSPYKDQSITVKIRSHSGIHRYRMKAVILLITLCFFNMW